MVFKISYIKPKDFEVHLQRSNPSTFSMKFSSQLFKTLVILVREIQERIITLILALPKGKNKQLSSCYPQLQSASSLRESKVTVLHLNKHSLVKRTALAMIQSSFPLYTWLYRQSKPQTTYRLGKIQIKSGLDYSHSFHSIEVDLFG